MGYIERSLSNEETVKYNFEFHWMTFVLLIINHLILPTALFYYFFKYLEPAILPIAILVTFISLTRLFYKILSLQFTEQAVTSFKVVKKTGIISTKTDEQLLSKIETIELRQGVIQRLFGYGHVRITGTGNSVLIFRDIDEPLDAKRKIESLLTR